jgi:hypothetical protein
VSKYPIDKNNIQPRVGLTYDLGGGKSVVRAGYGRFYEKTHFELIGGLFTATPFTSSFTVNFPTSAADQGPRNGQLPTNEFLVNGPVLNRDLLNLRFPAGQLLRNTGASWDNPDRKVPYTDQLTAGYERQLAGNMAISADYVHAFSRDLLMSKDLNPGLRATTAATSAVQRIYPSAELQQAYTVLQAKYPGFANFTTGVTQPQNVGKVDYDALLVSFNKRFSQNYSARVSYTLAYSRGNTTGNGIAASGFQVLDDMHLELNEGPTSFDTRHNFVVSGQALVPRTGGLNVSWVVRALSGSPFSLTNNTIDPDRNGTFAEPLPEGDYSGTGASDVYTVKGYKSKRNGANGPGFLNADLRLGYRLGSGLRRVELIADVFNVTNHVNFSNPSGNQGAPAAFLVLNGYSTSYAPRKLQLGARFQF